MKPAIVLVAAVLVAACGTFGSREAERYFVLEAAPASGATPQAASPMMVMPTTAASFYDTQDIVYSRSPGTRAYYQFNHWTERPQHALHAQLVSRLGAGGRPGGLILATQVEEIYHDAAQQPGTARMTITAQLIDPATRAVLARRSFSGSAPAATYDAPGAVGGMRQALSALLDEVVAWVGVQAMPAPKPGS
jgi:cholesterol transport system auxiliary component